MAGLADILKEIGLDLNLGGGTTARGVGPGTVAGPQLNQLQFEELKKLIGQRIPTISSPEQRLGGGFAPGGPQLNFTGGLPYAPDERPDNINNGLILATKLAEALRGLGGGGAGKI